MLCGINTLLLKLYRAQEGLLHTGARLYSAQTEKKKCKSIILLYVYEAKI
jgi:hypothetical protein